jgi:hypothetical protein
VPINTKSVLKRLTPFEFIEQAIVIHGNKYDYSKIKYVYTTDKVPIICPIHGDFEQTPNNHLKGCGCNRCGRSYKPSTEEFIQKAKEKYGEKYIYDKVEYNSSKTKVVITCRLHGDFEQIPFSHLFGKEGCKDCASLKNVKTKDVKDCASLKNIKTNDEFIRQAKEKHGEIYTYHNVNYKRSDIKVKITCLLHGDFEQRPYSHLFGQGCPDCSGHRKLDNKTFLLRAKEVHRDKYAYDNVKYKNIRTEVKITCRLHGDFQQRPDSHLKGHNGCNDCKKSDNKRFIHKAKEKHGEKYIYDKVEYIKSSIKVKITCPLHGDFEQTPNNHLHGKGCIKCSRIKKLNN